VKPPPEQNNRDGSLGLDVDLVRELSRHKLALIVDDDEDIVTLLKFILRREGINVVSAIDGAEALSIAAETQPQVVLLDIMMPGIDGWETLQRLKQFSEVPVVIISAILHEDAVVRAFELGAVDYVKKPFSHKEIVARIQAILNRAAPPEPHKVMVFPNSKILMDLASRLVKVADQPVKLTPQEYTVLAFLAQNAGKPVPYEVLCAEVWGEYSTDVHNRLKWVVHSLRKKLVSMGSPENFISNYQRFAYLLQDTQ
jgi:two-component system, OmpR family, KDP operon response regulator KdpE